MTRILAVILLLAMSFSAFKPTYFPNGLSTSKIEADELSLNGSMIVSNNTTVTTNHLVANKATITTVNAKVVIVGTQPEPSASEGMLWYDTITKTMNYFNGTSWIYW